ELVQQKQQFGRRPARWMLLGEGADEADEIGMFGYVLEHRQKPRVSPAGVAKGLKDVLIQIGAKKVRQTAVIGIVRANEGGDFRKGAPSLSPRPGTIDGLLQ